MRAALIAVLAVVIVALPGAARQTQPGEHPAEEETIVAQFGFAGAYVAEHWSPITVWVSAGAKALAGAIVVEYEQSDGQVIRLSAPCATTPGAQIPVQLVAPFPTNLQRVDVSFVDARGRPIVSARHGLASLSAPMPLPERDGAALLVAVGRSSIAVAHRSNRDASPTPDPATQDATHYTNTSDGRLPLVPRTIDDWNDVVLGRILDASTFPRLAMAFDGVRALITDTTLAVDERELQGLREWVLQGGCVVVIASEDGAEWQRWLPDLGPTPPVTLDPPTRAPAPASVAGSVPAKRWRPAGPPDLAADLACRPIRLSTDATERGWSLRWAWPHADPRLDGAALLAEGPAGLGWVTILGVDPERLARDATPESTGELWIAALDTILTDWSSREAPRLAQVANSWGQYESSIRATGLTAAAESMADMPVIGNAVFFAIGAATLALAVLIGPVDYFVLRKRRLLHRSWLTATGWTGLAGLAAFTFPFTIRTSETIGNSVTVVDVMQNRQGPTHAWRSTAIGVFAGQPGRLEVNTPDPRAWWVPFTGTIDSNPWQTQPRRSPNPVYTAVQRPRTLGDSTVTAAPPDPIGVGLWTYRTFVERRPEDHPPTARIIIRNNAPWLELTGVPESLELLQVATRTPWGTFYSNVAASERTVAYGPIATDLPSWDGPAPPTGTRMIPLAGPALQDTPTLNAPTFAVRQPYFYDYAGFQAPGLRLGLPGADRRTMVVEELIKRGGHACVVANFRTASRGDLFTRPTSGWDDTLARIVLPIDGEVAEALAAAAAAGDRAPPRQSPMELDGSTRQ